MIDLRPFRAWRPAPRLAHLVPSRSYVTYSPEELAGRLASNPHSFLHVLRPDHEGPHTPRAERFHRVRMAFKAFCDQGTLLRDADPCLYVYEQRAHGDTSLGLIAGVSTAAYTDGRIKRHEETLTAREQLFADYLQHTGINAEPVLLCTPEGQAWDSLLDPLTAARPQLDMITRDRVRHRLWKVDGIPARKRLQVAFASIPALYVADGHHRLASSARLAMAHQCTDVDPMAWCLAYIVPPRGLHIHNYDRIVRTLGALQERTFLSALERAGELRPTDAPFAAPGTIGVRTASGWHALTLRPMPEGAPAAARLDAARLSAEVLAPLLGIHDLRTDARIGFVPGTEGTAELDRQVRSGMAAAAFHLHPIAFKDLAAVADAGGTMPPKSTWIEPKLRSGLVVYSLEDV